MINNGAINNNATIDALNDVETTLTNNIDDVETTLTNNIDDVETTLTNNINNINTTLTNSINNINTTLTNSINNINTTLTNSINTKQDTITGGATTITGSNLTANRALIANGSGKVAVSSVTSTELGYLDGVTSALQTQINNRITAQVSKSANGYIKFNNGIIIQWGHVTDSSDGNANRVVSFPIAFTTTNYSLVSNGYKDSSSNNGWDYIKPNTKTTTSVTVVSSGLSCDWIAIGY